MALKDKKRWLGEGGSMREIKGKSEKRNNVKEQRQHTCFLSY